jgi:hypothetical protein
MMIRIYFKSKKKKVTKKQLQDHQDFERSINAIPLPSGGKYLSPKAKAPNVILCGRHRCLTHMSVH